jgi:tetratricopeptide (TPR) repeat protein
MNWVIVRRRIYLPMLIGLLLLVATIVFLFRPQPLHLLLIAGGLFVPGAIARYLLKDLLVSRILMKRLDFEGAFAAAQRFLASCAARPWMRHAIWGAFGVYTLDVVAMAQNNAGAALLELKRFDESEGFLLAARKSDPAYPLPVLNLAIIESSRGNTERAAVLREEARKLGMPANDLDAIHQRIGEAYASLGAQVG